LQEADESEDC